MKNIIKNAIETCKRDKYNQVVYFDENNECTFSRDCPDNNMYERNKIIGHVIGSYDRKIFKPIFIRNTKSEENKNGSY